MPEPMPRPNARRVLVVDDETDIREVARVSLEAIGGYEVRTSGGGEECLLVARSGWPEAILLDVMMPEMTGYQVVAALRADAATRDIPVVLLSATPALAARRALEELGVRHRITKPFDPLELPRLLAEELGWEGKDA